MKTSKYIYKQNQVNKTVKEEIRRKTVIIYLIQNDKMATERAFI
jgi:hypothetical protein